MKRVRARAPGRVNLIGEHTDYNDGFVLPVSIALQVLVDGVERDDRVLVLRSAKIEGERRFNLDALEPGPRGDWSDYVRGIAYDLQRADIQLRGAELDVSGDLPIGSGLSSSAAFEIGCAMSLLALASTGMDPLELARTAQRSDNAHTGARCGIMDQLACTSGRRANALLLDTRSLAIEHVPLPREAAIVACNTMVRHENAAGAYNERRAECERAAELLARRFRHAASLREATSAELEDARSALGDVLYGRARHVVSENARVLEYVAALTMGDLEVAGALMLASHASLRDDFDVSCAELDLMVELAMGCDGVYGARMTGGGFGGCAIALVARDHAEAFHRRIARDYHAATGVVPEIYPIESADGAEVRLL